MDRNIEHLHPAARVLCLRHQERADRYGLRTLVIETYRDEAAQLVDWQKGRDEHGNVVRPQDVVTNARPGASWHGLRRADGTPASFAYHLAIVRPGGLLGLGPEPGVGEELDGAAEALLEALARMGEDEGLHAGARFPMRDWMHFEYRPDGATLGQLQAALIAQENIAPPKELRT
jgi:hypothetical protein